MTKTYEICESDLPRNRKLYRIDGRRATKEDVDRLKQGGRLDCFLTTCKEGLFSRFCRVKKEVGL